jgi:methyl-accepting chemotaxis protein
VAAPASLPTAVAAPKVTPKQAAANNPQVNNGNELGKVVTDFNSAITSLGGVLGNFTKSLAELNGLKMSIEKQGKIEVVLNGAEVMKSIQGDLAESVTKSVLATLESQLPRMLGNLPAHT